MRVAIMDLGTNTFHLLIAEVYKDGTVKKIFSSKRTVKLGEGSIHRNYISPVPFQRGLNAISGYAQIIRQHRVDKVAGFATSAIRSATNGKEFVRQIFKSTGLRIRIITGRREAQLIYFGVRHCIDPWPRQALIVDIGGGSTEFIIADHKKILWKASFDIGAARLLELFRPSDPIKTAEVKMVTRLLDKKLLPLKQAIKKFPVHLMIGSSGSFDTLAEMIGWNTLQKNVLGNVKSYRFNLEEYYRLHKLLLSSTTSQRMKMKGLIRMRVDMIVLASICTEYILRRFQMKEMILSKYALKEGALQELVLQSRKETNDAEQGMQN